VVRLERGLDRGERGTAMSTIVGVMDRAGFEANTDNLVLVEPSRERLLWIPRDLWCDVTGDRINAAFRKGGHTLLLAAVREHGLDVDESFVVSRAATEAILVHMAVLVPIPVRMTFSYPLTPTAPIEDGSKEIVFAPPAEVLRGERIHQWVGARGGSDLHRIERQKVFVRRLLQTGYDFGQALADPDWSRQSAPAAIDDLARVRATWTFATLGATEPAVIDGKQVLRRAGPA
jgi:anionic cell wall polymer biosynthesis LytR-Cps2A-Psr (LCP) family protein